MACFSVLHALHVMSKIANTIETAIVLAWVLLSCLFDGGVYFEIQSKRAAPVGLITVRTIVNRKCGAGAVLQSLPSW